MASTDYIRSLYFVVTLLLVIYLPKFSTREVKNGGFSIDLIHRDSPNSPLYNPHETPLERLKMAFRHSIFRLNRFQSKISQSIVSSDNGQYLMKLSIGTPLFDIYGIVDTGSDLFWTQCKPCDQCYKQINPIFDPKTSSTYHDIPCSSEQCHLLGPVPCSPQKQNVCNYTYGYGGGATTSGFLAQETLTLNSSSGKPISLQNIIFGCGHNNTGGFNEHEMGLVGLGGGPISLISQIGSMVGGKKFSYFLVPFHSDPSITSKMNFGTGSEPWGDGTVSTPLVPKEDKTFYFVTLDGISVGNTFLPYNSSSQTVSKGNVFIDTGTPPTLLPQDLYNRLVWAVKRTIQMEPIKELEPAQLCYRSKTNNFGPILTAHFDGGANVQLMPMNIFIPTDNDTFCFTMSNTTGDIGIFGNFAQMNFWVGFDLEKLLVSFKPTDCTKHN